MPESVKSIKYLSQAELKGLFQVINSKRDKAIFLVAYLHGLRACEVGMLTLDDLDIDRGRIRIQRAKHSLGGEYPMQPNEIKVIRAWLRQRKSRGTTLFISQRDAPISRRMLDCLMKDYGEKAGIPPDKRHFHVLKHSIATHLMEAEADIKFVQDWIGHKDIRNTLVYAQITNKVRDRQAKKLFASPMVVTGCIAKKFSARVVVPKLMGGLTKLPMVLYHR